VTWTAKDCLGFEIDFEKNITFLTKNGQYVHEHAFDAGIDSLFACITAQTGEISVCFGSEISGKSFKFPPVWLKSSIHTQQFDTTAAGLCVQHTNGYIPSSYSSLSEFICVHTSDIFLEILSKSSNMESLTALTSKVVDPSGPSNQNDFFHQIADAVSRSCSSNALTRTKIASWCARLAEIENLPPQIHRLILTLCGLQTHQKYAANTLPDQSSTTAVFEISISPSSGSRPFGGVAFGGAVVAPAATAGDSKWKCVIAGMGVAYRNSPVFDDKDTKNFVSKDDIVSVVERVGPDDNWLKIDDIKHGTKYLPIKTSGGEVFFQPLNRAGVVMKFSGQTGRFYCGRRLGVALIPGSDGQCGPNNGPQCVDCKPSAAGFGAFSQTNTSQAAPLFATNAFAPSGGANAFSAAPAAGFGAFGQTNTSQAAPLFAAPTQAQFLGNSAQSSSAGGLSSSALTAAFAPTVPRFGKISGNSYCSVLFDPSRFGSGAGFGAPFAFPATGTGMGFPAPTGFGGGAVFGADFGAPATGTGMGFPASAPTGLGVGTPAAFTPLSASVSSSGLFGTSTFAFPACHSSSFLGSASKPFAAGTSVPVSFSSSSAAVFPSTSGSLTTQQPYSPAQSLFPLFLHEIFKQGFAVAEASFESWSLFCRRVEHMLCPAGYSISSSFFEMFHMIQSDSIYSAFFELSQSQCESMTKSLATPLSSLFHFISKHRSGSRRLPNNDVFTRASFLLEEFGNYHKL
jgi:hypothetical protein